MAGNKYLKNNGGSLQEEAAIQTSAGAGDAGKIPALNADGILDPTIVNAVDTSSGEDDAGKVAQLDAAGKLDITMMPTGIGPDAQSMTTSEALTGGDWVNIHNSSGAKVRKADATAAGKECDGFVLASAGSATSVTVYFEGANTSVSGQTPGPVFLQTSAGTGGASPPGSGGNVSQRLGVATSATSVNFERGVPITLAA